jgi:hypothetical protein
MKTKSVLALVMFVFAIGSAVASQLFFAQKGYSSITNVPVQASNCEYRVDCPGGSNPCSTTVDHDGNPLTSPISVPLYPGTPQGQMICGQQLFQQ